MARVFEVKHEKKQQNQITLDGEAYCRVFDDRWKSGLLDPRIWQVRLKRDGSTLLQLEFLSGSSDVIITTDDGRQSTLERRGMLKKHFVFDWNGAGYKWSKTADGYTLQTQAEGRRIAARHDASSSEGIITRITVHPTETSAPSSSAASMMSEVTLVNGISSSGLPLEVILGSALSIGAANIDGGVLSSRPPTGIYSSTSGRIVAEGHYTGASGVLI